MKSQTEAVQIALSAVGYRKTTAHGFTDPYGAQCVAMVAWEDEQVGGQTRIMPGYNAIDVYNKNPLGYAKIAPRDAKPGDYHFMNYVSGGVNYGHTGVVVEVTSTGVWSVDENWNNASLQNGSAAARIFHPFSVLVGLLRPPYNSKQEEPMSVVNDGDTINYFRALFGRDPDQAELDKNRNKEWNNPDPNKRAPLYNDMLGRGEYLSNEVKRLQKLVDDNTAQYEEVPGPFFKKK